MKEVNRGYNLFDITAQMRGKQLVEDLRYRGIYLDALASDFVSMYWAEVYSSNWATTQEALVIFSHIVDGYPLDPIDKCIYTISMPLYDWLIDNKRVS